MHVHELWHRHVSSHDYHVTLQRIIIIAASDMHVECTHLVEVDDGEPVCLSSPRIPHSKVEPLRVLVGVAIKLEIQLVVPLAPGEITQVPDIHTILITTIHID